MSEKTSADTVPGLGFKDKDKALETIKILEGRDPDYQRLAVKGLIGRAKRTLTLTKADDKLQNINDALTVFEDWLKNFEKLNLGKDNRAYLPLAAIQTLLPLKKEYNITDKKAEAFFNAYKSVKGEYKNLRTTASEEDGPTWDIVRNTNLKKILKNIEDEKTVLWDDDVLLPTKEHLEVILWAYSPDASKLKKALPKIAEAIGSNSASEDESISESDEDETPKKKKRSESSSDDEDEETPKKKSKK